VVRRAPRPASRRRLALRLLVRRDARCVRPTSAFSRSSYEHPRLVGSRCVMRFRACAIEEIACFTSERFASVGHTSSWCHRGGRCLPVAMRAVRTSDIPVASSTRVTSLARRAHSWRPPRRPPAPSRERYEPYEPPGMPSIAQEPLPRNALSDARLGLSPGSRLGHRNPGSRRFLHPRGSLRTLGSWAPVHAPRCQRVTRFSGPRRRLPTSAT